MNNVKDNDGPHATGMHRSFFNAGDLLELVATDGGQPADRDQHQRYFIATGDGGTTRLCDGVHWDDDAEDDTDSEYISVDSLTLTNDD